MDNWRMVLGDMEEMVWIGKNEKNDRRKVKKWK